jgi:hypothetical protein
VGSEQVGGYSVGMELSDVCSEQVGGYIVVMERSDLGS